jgi:hypothetical protein
VLVRDLQSARANCRANAAIVRRRTLATFKTLVALIGHTQTATGLRVKAMDKRRYKTGVVITPAEMHALAIDPHQFHGDWNYAVRPRAT